MTTPVITDAQRRALEVLAKAPNGLSADDLIDTVNPAMEALTARALFDGLSLPDYIRPRAGLWIITRKGRAALAAERGERT